MRAGVATPEWPAVSLDNCRDDGVTVVADLYCIVCQIGKRFILANGSFRAHDHTLARVFDLDMSARDVVGVDVGVDADAAVE